MIFDLLILDTQLYQLVYWHFDYRGSGTMMLNC